MKRLLSCLGIGIAIVLLLAVGLNEFTLSDGSALLLATEEWLTPEGRLIWHQGIAPDVQVSLPQGTSPLLPQAEAGMTPEQVQNSGDAQLLQALELLNAGRPMPPPLNLRAAGRQCRSPHQAHL
jgi:hypothetical protein